MPSFFVVTLGCKVNQYETQALRETWLAQGLKEAGTAAEADCIIVNSCAVTAKAVADVRSTIRQLHRQQPQAPVIVTGCAAEVMGKELSSIEGVQVVLPRKEKTLLLNGKRIVDLLSQQEQPVSAGDITTLLLAEQPVPAAHESADVKEVTAVGGGRHNAPGNPDYTDNDPLHDRAEGSASFPPFSITDYARSRAVLKIQDGCSHCCTYCIVPRARGGSISRPVKDSLDEAGRLLEAGFGEIIISGINLRQFRGYQPGNVEYTASHDDFWQFIEDLEARFASRWEGKARFRISSLEPGQLTARGMDVLASSRLIAPQLHLSLQSGSDTVLRRMGRGHYTVHDVFDGVSKLHSIWKPFGLGADIISGFPGETAAEHAETAALLERLPLTYAHVFPYSRRPHTIAARLPEQVPKEVAKERAAELRAIASVKKQSFMQKVAALPCSTVAVEQSLNKRGKAHGINEWYVDCEFIDDGVSLAAATAQKNKAAVLVKARPVRLGKDCILVEAIEDEA